MLHEKYRPRTWEQFIGQPNLVPRVRAVLSRAMATGDPLFAWVSGPSGTGKTTLARLAAAELGADAWACEEINGDELTADRAREIRDKIGMGAWGNNGGWRVWIINEAHAITDRAVQVLLGLLEPSMALKRRAFFFTTTADSAGLFGDFGGPLFSRCVKFPFTNQGLCGAFAARGQEIARIEGLDGAPIARYVRATQEAKNNFRALLSAIEGMELAGEPAAVTA
jgi:replication-associated recombination protein RarA